MLQIRNKWLKCHGTQLIQHLLVQSFLSFTFFFHFISVFFQYIFSTFFFFSFFSLSPFISLSLLPLLFLFFICSPTNSQKSSSSPSLQVNLTSLFCLNTSLHLCVLLLALVMSIRLPKCGWSLQLLCGPAALTGLVSCWMDDGLVSC